MSTPTRRRPTTAPVPGAHTLGCTLAALLREWQARVEPITADLPQGPRGYEVLAAVRAHEPRSQAALATSLRIDRTVMTYLLDAFEGCGLLERRPDPADRRARRLVLTEHGMRVLEEVDARVAAVEADLLSPLDEAERATLATLLRRPLQG